MESVSERWDARELIEPTLLLGCRWLCCSSPLLVNSSSIGWCCRAWNKLKSNNVCQLNDFFLLLVSTRVWKLNFFHFLSLQPSKWVRAFYTLTAPLPLSTRSLVFELSIWDVSSMCTTHSWSTSFDRHFPSSACRSFSREAILMPFLMES